MMRTKFKYRINFIAVSVAIYSFAIGTLCLLLFKTSNDTGFVGIGYFFTLFAALTNSIMLCVVLVNTLLTIKDYTEHVKTILVILANIPITYLYIGFVF